MKRIPKSFHLGAHSIRVDVIPKSKWVHPDCVGYFDPQANLIVLLKQERTLMLHTLLHEVTHAILHAMNHRLYSSEAFVDQFGGHLAQVLDTAE